VKLLGEKLMSRDFDRQVNELHARIAVLNHFTALDLIPKLGLEFDGVWGISSFS
jgi:hypothetical protein